MAQDGFAPSGQYLQLRACYSILVYNGNLNDLSDCLPIPGEADWDTFNTTNLCNDNVHASNTEYSR